MSKSKVPAKIRARQRWRNIIVQASTLDEKHQNNIVLMLALVADPPKNSEELEKILSRVEVNKHRELVHKIRNRIQEPYKKEALNYAKVGVRVAKDGNFEQAAYCAAMMMRILLNAESSLLDGDIQRTAAKLAGSSGGRKSGAKRRAQRAKDMDALARAWNKRKNDVKVPTLQDLANDTGLPLTRVKDLRKVNIKARAAALRLNEDLRK